MFALNPSVQSEGSGRIAAQAAANAEQEWGAKCADRVIGQHTPAGQKNGAAFLLED